ncbi:hypothetical protein RN228_004661 [Escherichia coli]|uniref:hypothetical protein n=1 Tax=Escherichia coli TaxID=562 RepID=UPI00066EF451|nr:hypothetical protein [Escherichia coli]EAN7010353.1 hypothetical protein [Salmonella enterica]ECZ2778080.1 hypothetical protein [Salmonella enterica subsp. enterica serovar London]EJI4307392.1 hypothetical protein [Shigella sonnei]EKY0337859.1 hypothetical protein [Escherichia coli O2:H6]MCO9483216.1 hypothetical protein [Salmonella enterica subsp. enterica serovar Give]MED6519884.1 hypothetical protein [Escherichia coli O157]
MKYVSFRVSNDDYEKLFTAIKDVSNKTPAKFFADLAKNIISKNTGFDKSRVDDDGTDLNHVKQVRLSTAMMSVIKEQALKNGWSESKEIRFRLNQTISNEPVLLDREIAELRGARNAVDRIGQNIFYIIAKRQLLEVNDPAFWDDIKKLNQSIDDVKKLVNKITLARQNVINVKSARKQG